MRRKNPAFMDEIEAFVDKYYSVHRKYPAWKDNPHNEVETQYM